jgi:hypothetical protein
MCHPIQKQDVTMHCRATFRPAGAYCSFALANYKHCTPLGFAVGFMALILSANPDIALHCN